MQLLNNICRPFFRTVTLYLAMLCYILHIVYCLTSEELYCYTCKDFNGKVETEDTKGCLEADPFNETDVGLMVVCPYGCIVWQQQEKETVKGEKGCYSPDGEHCLKRFKLAPLMGKCRNSKLTENQKKELLNCLETRNRELEYPFGNDEVVKVEQADDEQTRHEILNRNKVVDGPPRVAISYSLRGLEDPDMNMNQPHHSHRHHHGSKSKSNSHSQPHPHTEEIKDEEYLHMRICWCNETKCNSQEYVGENFPAVGNVTNSTATWPWPTVKETCFRETAILMFLLLLIKYQA